MTLTLQTDLTNEQAIEALKLHTPRNDTGTYVCPVCPASFDDNRKLGPHKAAHLRALGALPTLAEANARKRQERDEAFARLTGKDRARQMDRERKRKAREARKAQPAEVVQVTVFDRLDGINGRTNGHTNGHAEDRPGTIEVAMAVLSKLSPDGRVAITDLPEIVGWIEHTHRLAGSLH